MWSAEVINLLNILFTKKKKLFNEVINVNNKTYLSEFRKSIEVNYLKKK